MNPQFMREAIELAIANVRAGGGPFGAVVVREGVVLATGVNQVTSRNDPTAHAEVTAIRAACAKLASHRLTGCDLYATCEPCPMCLGAVYWARLDRVFYACSRADAAAQGFDDSLIYEECGLAPAARRIPMRQLLAEEASAVFAAWEHQQDRQMY